MSASRKLCFLFVYSFCQHRVWVLGLVLIRNHVDTSMNVLNFWCMCERAFAAVIALLAGAHFATYRCLICCLGKNSMCPSPKNGDSAVDAVHICVQYKTLSRQSLGRPQAWTYHFSIITTEFLERLYSALYSKFSILFYFTFVAQCSLHIKGSSSTHSKVY